MPGYLPLFDGMTAFITENLKTYGPDIGWVNMAKCTVTKVILDEREPAFNLDPRLPPHFLKYPPKCVLVKLHRTGLSPLTNLDHGVVPICQKSGSFQFMDNFKVERKQIPLTPGYSYTSFSCQGMTLDQAIVDLAYPGWKGNDDAADAYVFLSRVKTLSGLRILRDFDRRRLRKPRDELLWQELARLETTSIAYMDQTRQTDPAFPCLGSSVCRCTDCFASRYTSHINITSHINSQRITYTHPNLPESKQINHQKLIKNNQTYKNKKKKKK
jgi:hypothetical protein